MRAEKTAGNEHKSAIGKVIALPKGKVDDKS